MRFLSALFTSSLQPIQKNTQVRVLASDLVQFLVSSQEALPIYMRIDLVDLLVHIDSLQVQLN
jgi:hypothetical protein